MARLLSEAAGRFNRRVSQAQCCQELENKSGLSRIDKKTWEKQTRLTSSYTLSCCSKTAAAHSMEMERSLKLIGA